MVAWEGRLVPLTCHRRDGDGVHTGTTLRKSMSSTDAATGIGIASVRCVVPIITRDGGRRNETNCAQD